MKGIPLTEKELKEYRRELDVFNDLQSDNKNALIRGKKGKISALTAKKVKRHTVDKKASKIAYSAGELF